jgi:L-asparaginase
MNIYCAAFWGLCAPRAAPQRPGGVRPLSDRLAVCTQRPSRGPCLRLQTSASAEDPSPQSPPAPARLSPKRFPSTSTAEGPLVIVARPLPRVLLLHTGGTLGMDASASYQTGHEGQPTLRPGTGGRYVRGLRPGTMLNNILQQVPELKALASIDINVVFNKDSSNVGPKDWTRLARTLHARRDRHDAFLIIHGTDTMAYTASALSLMLAGFRKPIVMTGG